ncbi:menaquinone-specific isochorismate synthase [Arthrobacter stackebrandtii]|uniref:isochorismate synthase n=1 Tax=Arthrobacter stackebrandtii TaxID=272161 RepID=A0ABS4YX02_9MICC|nr:isochorismate synthase [Arthrobacter stackebrandtii]MBP2413130.1 menaquinone-specific isochorismate synthase [Arthrobacter stackebrandtii]PYH01103.1 isochorismate synthase [Arthrobacter stackebrandtii]
MTASFPLRAHTLALDPATLAELGITGPAGLLGASSPDGPLSWLRRGEGLLGFGEITSFTGSGPSRFADAEQWWKTLLASAAVDDSVRMPGTGAMAFGSFAFSKTSASESALIVPALVVGFSDGTAWLTQLTVDGTVPTAGAALALLRDIAASHTVPTSLSTTPDTPSVGTVRSGALTEEEWKASVRSGVAAIARGGLEKVVLARDVVAEFPEPVSRVSILQRLVALYDECWTYGVRGLVGATPEILIKVDGSVAQARVLAGTLDREDEPAGSTGFADAVLGGSLKQRHEHDFAVRSLTRQLAPFATDLSFPAEPFILELPNVWHLASDVTAQLASSNGHLPTSLALVEALHPTAAVCGTPREDAGKLILELEKMDRGPYAGPVGWLDGAGNGEWGIALRGAVLEDPHHVRLYAGAGIVEASDPEAELAETWAKFRPMLQALQLPNHP